MKTCWYNTGGDIRSGDGTGRKAPTYGNRDSTSAFDRAQHVVRQNQSWRPSHLHHRGPQACLRRGPGRVRALVRAVDLMSDDWPLPAKRKYSPVNPGLSPVVPNRDPAQPVVFYSLSAPNGAEACCGADDRDASAPNSATFDAAVIELQRVTFAARWRRLLFYWSRRQLRAQRRLAKRHGRVRVRAGVGELRHDLPTGNGPSPGRLVTMSPCRAMAPPAQFVAPISADALGSAA
jgi:hypothetical protein